MKKNNPLITVVIPCYHVEDVVGCIFSDLKKQSLSDFEMVFVNDGGRPSENLIREANN